MAAFDNFSFLDQMMDPVPNTFNINFSQINDISPEFLPKNLENFNFEFAATDDPSSFCDTVKHSKGEERKIMDFHKGTTTLGFFIILKLSYKIHNCF